MRCPSNASATGDAMIDLASAYGSLRAMLDEQGHKGWSCAIDAQYHDFHEVDGPMVVYTASAVVLPRGAITSGTRSTPEAAIAALRQKFVGAPEPAGGLE